MVKSSPFMVLEENKHGAFIQISRKIALLSFLEFSKNILNIRKKCLNISNNSLNIIYF